MSTQLDFERIYPHARDKVWRALSEPQLIARWLMPVEDFAPEVGQKFRFVTEPAPGFDGIVHCEVLAVEPPQMLRFSWRGGPIDTIVTFRLEEATGGTRLIFEQAGFRGFKAWLTRTILKAGFKKMYAKRLPELLAELDGGPTTLPARDPKACGGPVHRTRLLLLSLFKRNQTG